MGMISVIICTYNRVQTLTDTLDALLKQKFTEKFGFEVIIIDNNSTDNTKEVVMGYKDRFKGKLQYLFESRRGKSFALNSGIQAAKGDILAFTDSDVIPDCGWLWSIHEGFKTFDCDALQGRIMLNINGNIPSWLSERFMQALAWLDYGDLPMPLNQSALVGSNMAIKQEVFDKIGGFNTFLGPGRSGTCDDAEISIRIRNIGGKQYYYPEAKVYHQIPQNRLTKKAFRHLFFIYGFSDLYIEGIHSPLLRFILYTTKMIFKELLNWVTAKLGKNIENKIWSECQVYFHLGRLNYAISNNRKTKEFVPCEKTVALNGCSKDI